MDLKVLEKTVRALDQLGAKDAESTFKITSVYHIGGWTWAARRFRFDLAFRSVDISNLCAVIAGQFGSGSPKYSNIWGYEVYSPKNRGESDRLKVMTNRGEIKPLYEDAHFNETRAAMLNSSDAVKNHLGYMQTSRLLLEQELKTPSA
jgi:hypothetical protein